MSKLKVLFATAEAAPLVKTGGLGDVAGSLPSALQRLDQDVRVIMPAYRQTLTKMDTLTIVDLIKLHDDCIVRVLEGKFPGTDIVLWLIDAPKYFDRQGGPYCDDKGHDWPDNAERFSVFAKAIEQLATGKSNLSWHPDIVHCNDWQTGLVPALIARHETRPATVFTIHNLAYQGNFDVAIFNRLRDLFQIPSELWTLHGMEFHNLFSFMKGGLVFSDMLNTVSPTYAKEICTAALGNGMEGLLQHRSDRLRGILNGVDYQHWNPKTDPLIKYPFDLDSLSGKQSNKQSLQNTFNLPVSPNTALIGMVGRLVEQKGVDLALEAIPRLIENHNVQFVLLGSGHQHYEDAYRALAANYPFNFAANIGFSETLAHQIEAGSDMFLMPSRYEPCGLNQIYSLKYGAVPIVRRTGGLADTVVNTTKTTLKNNTASGFLFDEISSKALYATLEKALHYYNKPKTWRNIIRNGMRADFSWTRSARDYIKLYKEAINHLSH